MLKNMATSKLTGNENAGVVKVRAIGRVRWHVAVGDELIPGQPILDVGKLTFFHQPAYKAPRENPKLYVAKLILDRQATAGDLAVGYPLLVAVYNTEHLARFESFIPSAMLLQSLGSKVNLMM